MKTTIITLLLLVVVITYDVDGVEDIRGCIRRDECSHCISSPNCGWCIIEPTVENYKYYPHNNTRGVCLTGNRDIPSSNSVMNPCVSSHSGEFLVEHWRFSQCPSKDVPNQLRVTREMLESVPPRSRIPQIPSVRDMRMLIEDNKRLHPRYTAIQPKPTPTPPPPNATILEQAKREARKDRILWCKSRGIKKKDCGAPTSLDEQVRIVHHTYLESVADADKAIEDAEAKRRRVVQLSAEADRIHMLQVKAFKESSKNASSKNTSTYALTQKEAQSFAVDEADKMIELQKELDVLKRAYERNVITMKYAHDGKDPPKPCTPKDDKCWAEQKTAATAAENELKSAGLLKDPLKEDSGFWSSVWGSSS